MDTGESMLGEDEVARALGEEPGFIRDGFNKGWFNTGLCPLVAGRWRVPQSYIPTMDAILRRRAMCGRPLSAGAQRGLAAKVERKLLAVGGAAIHPHDWPPDHWAAGLPARGRLYRPRRPVLVRGEPGWCRSNAAAIWGSAPDAYRLVTGYGLCGQEGLWYSHTWLIDRDVAPGGRPPRLYETDVPFKCYFGAPLSDDQALAWWAENFAGRYCFDTFPMLRGPAGARLLATHGLPVPGSGGPTPAAPAAPARRAPGPATMAKLEKRLLGLGGKEVRWPGPDARLARRLLAKGRPFGEPTWSWDEDEKLEAGNPAGMWGIGTDFYDLCVGFALDYDGVWAPRCWASEYGIGGTDRDHDRVHETPGTEIQAYYGVVLGEDEALGHWVKDFLVPYGAGPMRMLAAPGGREILERCGLAVPG